MEFLEGASIFGGLLLIGHIGAFHFFGQGFGELLKFLVEERIEREMDLVNEDAGDLEVTLVEGIEEVLDLRNSLMVWGSDDSEGGTGSLEEGLSLISAFTEAVIELAHGEEEVRELLQGLHADEAGECFEEEVVAVFPEAKAPAAGGEHGHEEAFGDGGIQEAEESAWGIQEVQCAGGRGRIQDEEGIVSAHFKLPKFFYSDVFLGAGEGIGEGVIEAVVKNMCFLAGSCMVGNQFIPGMFHIEHHRPEGGWGGGGVEAGEGFEGDKGFMVTQVVYTEGTGEAFSGIDGTHEAFSAEGCALEGESGGEGGFSDAAGADADKDFDGSQGPGRGVGTHRSSFIFWRWAAREETVFRAGYSEGRQGSLKTGIWS